MSVTFLYRFFNFYSRLSRTEVEHQYEILCKVPTVTGVDKLADIRLVLDMVNLHYYDFCRSHLGLWVGEMSSETVAYQSSDFFCRCIYDFRGLNVFAPAASDDERLFVCRLYSHIY